MFTATGAEPFVVFLPTAELEVVVMCSLEIDVALFPLYGVQAGGSIPRVAVATRSDKNARNNVALGQLSIYRTGSNFEMGKGRGGDQ